MATGKGAALFSVEYSQRAAKVIDRMDSQDRARLMSWINANLDGTENPRTTGKPLSGNLGDVWRYRVGDYRIIAEIHDKEVVILVVDVGHRSEVYGRYQRHRH